MSSGNRRRRKSRREKRQTLLQAFCGLMMILLVTFLVLSCVDMVRNRYAGNKKEESEEKQETVTVEPKEEEPDTEDIQPVLLQKEDISLTDTDIYSFLQGPAAWENRTDWGGSWCNMILADQYFGAFGCGLCDLANIYSTLTPYECSPIDMYYYAQEASGYTPVSGLGAIDWPELQDTLQSVGINCELRTKDDNYEDFQNALAEGITAIVLISSAYDTTYWKNSDGHYVNLWMYDPADDTAFLADSGNYGYSRERISLRPVYDALLPASSYQYLLVTSVDTEGNTWQHDGIDIDWVRPDYI